MLSMSKKPQTLWAQDKQHIFITVQLSDSKDLDLQLKEDKIEFSAKKDSDLYQFALDLFKPVAEGSWHKTVTNRNIQLVVDKKEQDQEFWPRLQKEQGKLNWLKVDFSKFVDEDEDDEPQVPGQPDFSQFMANMGQNDQMNLESITQGMNFEDKDEPDSDDEEMPELEDLKK
ncbi:HSP20-like chaperone [Gorgonomyces haynaldii]|nr:HSP20-like chaperone [Gorgonomyces haynaldii]